ncbi:hypothetical protein [Actinomadura sp. GTD37]|uniref:hypothetical protein n=1 Tax=Actinomadura sp. GTD37 TaxID=1778030 RepID=UPI0035BF417F
MDPGFRLDGRYRMERRVGRRGPAQVRRAHDELLARRVADSPGGALPPAPPHRSVPAGDRGVPPAPSRPVVPAADARAPAARTRSRAGRAARRDPGGP